MRKLLFFGLTACLVGSLAWWYGSALLPHGAVPSAMTSPETGAVANGRYSNRYFDLSYPLPEGWTEGLAGPEPSETGYYVLSSLAPTGELDARLLIAAQDNFFAPKPDNDAAAAASDFRDAMARVDGMEVDQPAEMKIASHMMQRVNFSGVGLYRAMFVTDIRCHFVSFNLTARSPQRLAELAGTLEHLSRADGENATTSAPVCIKDFAVAENLLHRVEPDPADPKFTPIPVRIIIGRDGTVKHVHVIHGSPQQRRNIQEALFQWKFKPPRINGEAVEVETGLLFRFTVAQN
jgi:Gram-negative bacterial TonB protein C-terminal